MKIGDINVAEAILNLEHDVNVMQQVLTYIGNNNSGINLPSQQEVNNMKKNAISMLQKKYPKMGIGSK